MKALGYTKDQAPGAISPYLPDFTAEDIADVDFVLLKNMGVTHLMLDLDGTLRKAYSRRLEAEVIEVFRQLQDRKLFKVIAIASNNNFRLQKFAKPIGARVFQPYWHNTRLIRKPHPLFFSHVMDELGIEPSQAVMIGDRLRSDIVGANRAGIRTVLIKQRGSGYWFDHILLSKIREQRHYERALHARRLHMPSTLRYLRDALQSSNLPHEDIERIANDATKSTSFVATSSSRKVFIKLVSRQHTFVDRLHKYWLRFTFRFAEANRGPYNTPAEALSNEARVLAQAAAAKVRVPKVHELIDMGDGRFALILEYLLGTTLNLMPERSITDTLLNKTWQQITRMHKANIAHGDLRAANIMVRGNDVYIIDFDEAADNASVQQVHQDIGQFIASTAELIGVKRAVQVAAKYMAADIYDLRLMPGTLNTVKVNQKLKHELWKALEAL